MERKLGDIANRVIFENERVRIWEMRMAPGELGAAHRHELDHILVQIAGGYPAWGIARSGHVCASSRTSACLVLASCA